MQSLFPPCATRTHAAPSSTPPCQVLAELLLHLGEGANPNALYAARRHVLTGTMLSGGAAKAVKLHRAATLESKGSGMLPLTRVDSGLSSQGKSVLSEVDEDAESESSLARKPTAADLTNTVVDGFGAARLQPANGAAAAAQPTNGAAATPLLNYGVEGHVLGEHRLRAGTKRDEVEGVWQRVTALTKNRKALMADANADAAKAAMGALASNMNQMLEDQVRFRGATLGDSPPLGAAQPGPARPARPPSLALLHRARRRW